MTGKTGFDRRACLAVWVIAVSGAFSGGHAASAQAGFLTGTYFTVPGSNPDFDRHTQDTANVTGLVENYLGPDGLPVRSSKGATYPGPTPPRGTSGPITDVNSQNEILWWSTTSTLNSHAVYEKTEVDAVPFSFNNLVPTGQSSDTPNLLAVHFQGTFDSTAGQSVIFTNSVDDDLYGYVDGNLVIDEGGVVHRPSATTTLSDLTPGQHTLDLFYVDREAGGAFFDFTSNVTLSATAVAPEPTTLVLFTIGSFAPLLRRRLTAAFIGTN